MFHYVLCGVYFFFQGDKGEVGETGPQGETVNEGGRGGDHVT